MTFCVDRGTVHEDVKAVSLDVLYWTKLDSLKIADMCFVSHADQITILPSTPLASENASKLWSALKSVRDSLLNFLTLPPASS